MDDIETVARTLWGEARGEGYIGQQAVANVIMRRVALKCKGDTNAKDVCLHHSQFSCWLQSDPNRPKLLAVTQDDPVFRQCLGIATLALSGNISDVTNLADSYEATGTGAYWAKGLTPCAVIGRHSFFKTVSVHSIPDTSHGTS